jgi:YbgC/YbaW family acyl-CoA thioester hydrolase
MADELTIHIYPSDCDTAGHVNHAYMLMLLERARWAALERHMQFDEYLKRALTAVVRHIDASYSMFARPGDEFRIRTGLTSIGNTSFKVKQTAHNQHGALLCEANIVYVTISPEGKPMPVPDHWRSIFSPWEDS